MLQKLVLIVFLCGLPAALLAQETETPATESEETTEESSSTSSSGALFATAAAEIRASSPADSSALQSALEVYAAKIHLGHSNAVGRALLRLNETERERFREIIAGHQASIGSAEAAKADETAERRERFDEHQRELQRLRATPRPVVVMQYQRNNFNNNRWRQRRRYGNVRHFNPQLEWIRQNQENYQRWLQYNSRLYQQILGLR